MKRIGIFGGTFNPPHEGHVHFVRAIMARVALDRLLIVPTNIPPHKDTVPVSAEMRLEMAKLAFGEVCGVEISDIEIKASGTSYTVDTLEDLERIYPGDELVFFVGSDMFLSMEHWHRAGKIFKMCSVICAARDSEDAAKLESHAVSLRERFGARCEVLAMEPLEVSSTQVREMIGRGEDTSGLVPEAVKAYIDEKRLYV